MSAVLHAFADEEAPARRLAGALGIEALFVDVHRYPDGELLPRIPGCADTTIVYRSLNQPNEKLVELVLAAEAWRRNGARRLVLVAPYLCYMRQDMAFTAGEAISQSAVGGLLGDLFDRIVTVDAHLHRTHDLADVFPDSECANLLGASAIAREIMARGVPPNLVVIGPDAESRAWAEAVAAPLGAACEVMSKERRGDATVFVHPPASLSIAGRPALIVDDVASTGATLVETARLVQAAGAASLAIGVTHALFNDTVTRKLQAMGVKTILSSDSCPHQTNGVFLAPLLAEALRSETSP